MAYVRQNWQDGTSIANAERLNHIEDGIYENSVKIDGTILYEDNSGTTGNITLNDSASNYKYLEIYYRSNDPIYNSVKIDKNNGTVALFIPNWYQSVCYFKFKQINISETSITNVSNTVGTTTIRTTGVTSSELNQIYIYKVIGYKQ